MPKKTYPINEFWKWIVEAQDIDAYSKTITFKSNAQIVNQFNTALDIYCLKREKALLLGQVKPLSILELPMDAIYGLLFLFGLTLSTIFRYQGMNAI